MALSSEEQARQAFVVALEMINQTLFRVHQKVEVQQIQDYIYSIEDLVGKSVASELYELIDNIILKK